MATDLVFFLVDSVSAFLVQRKLVKLRGQPVGKTSQVGNSNVETKLQTSDILGCYELRRQSCGQRLGFVCAEAIATKEN